MLRPAPTACLALLWLGAVAPAAAQDGGIAFDIPAQPLDAALDRYFRLTGVELLYDSRLALGLRSTAVRGRLAPPAALALLLAGTGLVARYSSPGAVVLTRPEPPGPAPLVPLGRVVVRAPIGGARLAPAERLAYYQRIEDALRARLRADPRTARLIFDLLAEIRISGEGSVVDVALVRGSGHRQIDAAVRDTLRDTPVAPPPPLLDQPLRIALRGARD